MACPGCYDDILDVTSGCFFPATHKNNNQPVPILSMACPGCGNDVWDVDAGLLQIDFFIFLCVAKCLAMRVGHHHHCTLETEFFNNPEIPMTLWVGIVIVCHTLQFFNNPEMPRTLDAIS